MNANAKTPKAARKPKCRTLKLLRWNAAQRLGVLDITEGKEVAIYSIVEIEAGYAERAFRLAKATTTFTASADVEAAYCVAIERQGNTCECMGHLRHGHRTPCRHIAAVAKLLELGKI